jgi:glycosyltransferase involved in cell wall biosynthesis
MVQPVADKKPTTSDEVVVTDVVSLIIPAKNSAHTLEVVLESVKAQTYPHIELIVVDNHSTDNTVEIARRYTDNIIISGPERSPQGNIGAKAATGDWVYFIGSDFLLDPTIIEEAVETAHRENADAILTPNHSDPTVSRWARARAFERSMYVGDDTNVAARFIKRSLYLDMGGQDENLIAGEDYDFHARLLARGGKIAWVSATELHIGEPRTVGEVIRKHYFYGGDLRKYVNKHGKGVVMQLSPLRPAFARHWKKFFRHPLQTLNFVLYMVIKYAAGGAGWIFGGKGKGHTKLYAPKGNG